MAKKKPLRTIKTKEKNIKRRKSTKRDRLASAMYREFLALRKSKPRKKIRKTTRTKKTLVITDSRKLGKTLLIKRYETVLSSSLEIPLTDNTKSLNKALLVLKPYVTRQYTKLSPSYKHSYFLRIGYSYNLKGNRLRSYFSHSISEERSLKDIISLLTETLEDFQLSLNTYLDIGFKNIVIDSLSFQSYENV